MTDNLVTLDLRRFTPADAAKIDALQKKVAMMRRWCRCERLAQDGHDIYALYSGDRGRQPYASYRIVRLGDGTYALHDGRSDRLVGQGRTIDAAIDALPDDFYFARY